MGKKKKDYGPKESGQQFEEIQEAQRQQSHDAISKIDKSKQRDIEELKQLGDEALENLRQRKAGQDQPEM